MTPVPKKKHTRSRSNQRKNALTNRAKLPMFTACPNCGKLRETHKVCPSCGFYKGDVYK